VTDVHKMKELDGSKKMVTEFPTFRPLKTEVFKVYILTRVWFVCLAVYYVIL
jgi:hypothetical protein